VEETNEIWAAMSVQGIPNGWAERPMPVGGEVIVQRRAEYLLDDVLQGLRTVAEADAAYGGQDSGRAGRPRRWRTFADYLRDRIAYAESATATDEVLRLLTRAAGNGGHSSPADTMRINRLLTETGPARAAQLRELLAELSTNA